MLSTPATAQVITGTIPLGVTTDANFGTLDVTVRMGRTPRYMQLSMKLSF